MSGNSVVVSRDSRRPTGGPGTPNGSVTIGQQAQRRPNNGQPITCNRCRKPLSTTVFICACDCVFCEECTYNHFNNNSNCPICNRILSENDFTEVVVADLSTSTSTRTTNFQSYFTKQNASSPYVAFQDYCSRLLKQVEDLRSGSKFLMKQFLVDTSKQSQRLNQALQTMERLKQENTSLKQTVNSQQLRFDKTVENFQQQLALAEKKLEEKERQLVQFRKLHGIMTPDAPVGQTTNNGPRRVSGEGIVSSSSRAHHSSAPMVHPQQSAPPMKGFMIQKEAQERARQHALEAPQRSRVLGIGQNAHGHRPHSYAGNDTYGSPAVQQGIRPHSTGSGGSGGIRNLNTSSAFAFSGGATNKRRRELSPSGGHYVQAHSQFQGPESPSQAFGMHQPSGYSAARGPPNYFQQQQGYNQR